MNKLSRALAVAMCLSMLAPTVSFARESTEVENEVGHSETPTHSNESCKSVTKEVRKANREAAKLIRMTFRNSVKANDKTFADAMKAAEKAARASIKAGGDKEAIKATLKTTRQTLQTTRKEANKAALAKRDADLKNLITPCVKGISTIMSNPEDFTTVRQCVAYVKDYVKQAIVAGEKDLKDYKATHPSAEDLKAAKGYWKDYKKELNSYIKNAKKLCTDYLKENPRDAGSVADQKRLADVRQVASALELYYNDYNGYPMSLSMLAPTYIGEIPVAPRKSGSKCSAKQNKYTYNQTSASNYTLTFCLGKSTGGLTAGPHTLSEAGIN